MFAEDRFRKTTVSSPETLELLRELENCTPDTVKARRAHVRKTVRASVVVYPASRSSRDGTRLQGMTGDISAGGAQVLIPEPLQVDDVFMLEFDRNEIDLTPIYARCLRVRMVREGAFEAGVRFLQPVNLKDAIRSDASAAVV